MSDSATAPVPKVPVLSMWVIYDHPKDEPDHFIARRWLMRDGQMVATRETITCQSVAAIRGFLSSSAFTRINRSASDDASILEIWL